MTLKVLTPGPLSLLQDLGRFGYQSVGVCSGGPMDEHAFHWANRLLDNDLSATQIEITMGQFSCEFSAETMVALTGADMSANLNGVPVANWQSFYVTPGDRLTLRGSRQGMRAYLAIKGGFSVSSVLSSCATVVRDGLGGLGGEGERLKANDCIKYEATILATISKRVPPEFVPIYPSELVLDVIPSCQYQDFSAQQRQRFFASDYTVSQQMDRMGYRLSGEAIECQRQNLISEGIALGAIQIPADGQPIVLMRDRQTIGGYPKIGCLTARSVSHLAQSQPGTIVRFKEKNLQQAESERRTELQFFHGYVGKQKTAHC
ncbi:biotin-dependent carboxyltransferase family protein [Vibrio profundum]|uniref:5-oxoprolinase subunit C family protein n=1 Tax=Vibrio profundum TaxID=2910247 RepID=UPI003D0DC619